MHPFAMHEDDEIVSLADDSPPRQAMDAAPTAQIWCRHRPAGLNNHYRMRTKGKLSQVDVEGTGAYGAGLARYLLKLDSPVSIDASCAGAAGDPIDAASAARTVLAGKASGAPKIAMERSELSACCTGRPQRRG